MKAFGFAAGDAAIDYGWTGVGGALDMPVAGDVVVGEIPLHVRSVVLAMDSDRAGPSICNCLIKRQA